MTSYIILNLITFGAFALDKYRAIKNQWRIPESALLGLCFLGGALGGFVGMKVCHHKTLKPLFSIGIPVLLVIQIAIYGFLIKGNF